jgi:hypothetical protein
VTITITAAVKGGTVGTSVSNQGTWSFDADGDGTNETSVLTDDPSVVGAANATVFTVAAAPVTPVSGVTPVTPVADVTPVATPAPATAVTATPTFTG